MVDTNKLDSRSDVLESFQDTITALFSFLDQLQTRVKEVDMIIKGCTADDISLVKLKERVEQCEQKVYSQKIDNDRCENYLRSDWSDIKHKDEDLSSLFSRVMKLESMVNGMLDGYQKMDTKIDNLDSSVCTPFIFRDMTVEEMKKEFSNFLKEKYEKKDD